MSNASLKDQLKAVSCDILTVKPKKDRSSRSLASSITAKKPTAPVKPKWLDAVFYGLELLKTYFPQCFHDAQATVPLKKGIKQDLVKALSILNTIVVEDKVCMIKALSYYVNTIAYHKKVLVGAMRIDLNGESAGPVTEEEAAYSVKRLQDKQQARKNASASSDMDA